MRVATRRLAAARSSYSEAVRPRLAFSARQICRYGSAPSASLIGLGRRSRWANDVALEANQELERLASDA